MPVFRMTPSRSIAMGAVLFVGVILLSAVSVWLWQPGDSAAHEHPVHMSLSDAIRDTKVLTTIPRLSNSSVHFTPVQKSALLPASSIIAAQYKSLVDNWYPGSVEVFHAESYGTIGGPNGANVWVLENHMPFSHSEPWQPKWRLQTRTFIQKLRLLTGTAKPLTATTFQVYDASTGDLLGDVRTENGGF